MTYRTPASRHRPVKDVLRALKDADRILLTTHINADGDGVGSEVALGGWLRARGKQPWIVNPTPFPKALRFLISERDWVVESGSQRAREVAEAADLAVVLDTGELPRIGSVLGLVGDVKKIVIDHHPPGPAPISGLSLRDPGACATGELVFDLLAKADGPWLPEVVNGVYVAILADTGSFQYGNTTPGALRIAAFLLEKGADPEELHRLVFGNVPLRKYRLLQACLEHLEVDPEGDIAWMTVPNEAMDTLGARADDIEGLVNYPRGIEGVEVGLLFRETARGATKISFRSNGRVDVNALALRFGGGGHVKASGALVHRPLVEVRNEVLDAVRKGVRGRGQDERE